MASLWEQGTPLTRETPTIPTKTTSTLWEKGKPTKTQDKISWEAGTPKELPKSLYQKSLELIGSGMTFALGEGMSTGEFEHMTMLGKTLDLFGRPGYAIKSAINEEQQNVRQYLLDHGLSEEEINNPLSAERDRLLLQYKPQLKKRFDAMWRGFSGQERITANQLWDNIGARGVPFLGFMTEVALDPLMWAGGAGYATLGKIAKKGVIKPTIKVAGGIGKQLGKVPGISHAANYAMDVGGGVKQAAYNMFVTKSHIPDLALMVDKYLSRRKWIAGKGLDFGVKTRDAIVKVARHTKKSTDDVEKMIVNIIEQPRKYKHLASQGEKAIAKAVQNRLQFVFTEMTDAGVPITALGAARRQRIAELTDDMATAVGQKKIGIMEEILAQKQALEDDIIRFTAEMKPLEIDVAHFSKNPNIVKWEINKKTIKNDLGTDFGTESAALARKQDIAKTGGGKMYHTKISPRKSVDATNVPEQLQYWDNPDEVLAFIQKTGVLSPSEYDDLARTIPRSTDPKFRQIGKTKMKSQLVAQPGADDESGLVHALGAFRKGMELTDDEFAQLALVKEGLEATLPTSNPAISLRVIHNPEINKFNVYKISSTPAVEKFVPQKFYTAQNDWYTNFRQRLINKGYDSIKYYSLEDKITPTYKVLTSRIIGPASKRSMAQQQRAATMITNKEAEVAELINRAKEIYSLPVSEKRILSTAKKLGVAKKEAKNIAKLQRAREMGYFPRFTTREAEAYLKNAAKERGFGAKIWNPKVKNALRRKTSDFTLEEWNAFVAEHGLESLGGNKIETYFMRDPAYAVTLYQTRAAKAITSAEFVQDVVKTFGKSIESAPPFWVELPDSITKLYPSAKGLRFDPEVVAEVVRVGEHYINPGKLNAVVRAFDNLQNMWRKWTLAPFPKYHLRNMVGNMWNNYLADVDPVNYARAQAIQLYRKYKGTGKLGEKVALLELNKMRITPQIADDIINVAEELGVLGRGWYAADIELGIRQQLGGGGLIQRGLRVGTTIENNARLGHFMDKLDKGMDSIGAAASVKKYLFDYGDLTTFEREVMRRVFPFYTWSRKNIPLQMRELYSHPEKFAPLAIPIRMRDEEDIIKLKYARPDLYERLPIEIRRTMDTVTYVPLEGLIPAGDLAKMIRPHEMLFELLSPYIRAPIELQMNKSMYFESELQKYPGETQEIWRLPVPAKLKYVLTTVLPQARLVSEIDKIVKKQVGKMELTPAEQMFSQSLSSIYKVELKDLRRRALVTMEKKVQELRLGMGRARRAGRKDEEARIRKTYEQVKDEIRRIKGR